MTTTTMTPSTVHDAELVEAQLHNCDERNTQTSEAGASSDESLTTPDFELGAANPSKLPDTSPHYFQDDKGIYEVLIRWTRDGPSSSKCQLASFSAKIVSELELDDGIDNSRRYEIEAKVGNLTTRFSVAATEFAKVSAWAAEQLGSAAFVTAIPRAESKVAEAIMRDSHPKHRTVFTHTGWRQIDLDWVYLTAEGALGVEGLLADVDVELVPPLDRYRIPDQGDVSEGVKTTLAILEVAPDRVTFPLLGTVWRSLLGPTDFVPSLVGTTGAGKSVLSAFAQQHWGAGLDGRALPGSWSSTKVALESLAFETKDALVVIDDYAPGGGVDIKQLCSTAEYIIRSVGNQSTRSRGQVDGKRHAPRYPRGTVMSTGEDYPKGASVIGRMFNTQITHGDVDFTRCTPIQQAAAKGVLAVGLGGFIRWLAADLPTFQIRLKRRSLEIRDEVPDLGHNRTPGCVGDLLAAWELWCEWATALRYITASESQVLLRRARAALTTGATDQKALHAEVDPCNRFVETLAAVLSSGAAHVTDAIGNAPSDAGRWGWHQDPVDAHTMRPSGSKIGWITDDGLYLIPVAAVASVQELARKAGDRFDWTQQTLSKRLAEGGHLASTDLQSRKSITVRKTFEGVRSAVLHFPTNVLGETQLDDQLTLVTSGPVSEVEPEVNRIPVLEATSQGELAQLENPF